MIDGIYLVVKLKAIPCRSLGHLLTVSDMTEYLNMPVKKTGNDYCYCDIG